MIVLGFILGASAGILIMCLLQVGEKTDEIYKSGVMFGYKLSLDEYHNRLENEIINDDRLSEISKRFAKED